MAYKRNNLKIIKYGRGFYSVDYVTPSVGRTLKIVKTKSQAMRTLRRLTKKYSKMKGGFK